MQQANRYTVIKLPSSSFFGIKYALNESNISLVIKFSGTYFQKKKNKAS